MIALRTRFAGPTNHTGARVTVVAEDGEPRRRMVHWDHALDVVENHERAVQWWVRNNAPELIERGWDTLTVHRASTRDGYLWFIGAGEGA